MTPLALIIGFLQLSQSARAERRQNQKERDAMRVKVYEDLDEQFSQFQFLCLQYPHLDVFEIPDPTPPEISPQQQKEEIIVFARLLTLFERAFLLYLGMDAQTRKLQWSGWDEYIRSYCSRANFRNAWDRLGFAYDFDFQQYIETQIKPAQLAQA